MYSETFPQRIKEARKKSGYTQQQVEEETGIKRERISDYENGKIEPNIEQLGKLAHFYNVNVNWLISVKIENKQNKIHKKTFSQRIKEARIKSEYTQIEIEQKTGIKQATISKYESGKLEPSLEQLGILAQFYNVSINWLLGVTLEKTKKKIIIRKKIKCQWKESNVQRNISSKNKRNKNKIRILTKRNSRNYKNK